MRVNQNVRPVPFHAKTPFIYIHPILPNAAQKKKPNVKRRASIRNISTIMPKKKKKKIDEEGEGRSNRTRFRGKKIKKGGCNQLPKTVEKHDDAQRQRS